VIKRNTIIGLLGLLVLLSCSRDDEPQAIPVVETESDIITLGMSASTTGYTEAPRRMTRSWTPPTDYLLYNQLYGSGAQYTDMTSKAIDVFLALDPADPHYATATRYSTTEVDYRLLHGRLRYVASKDSWKFALSSKTEPTKVQQGQYYVYGFIPRDAADEATLEQLPASSTYADGAKLTIHGMNTTASDVCVIIGAREGFCTGAGTEGDPYIYYDGSWEDVTPGTADVYDPGTDNRINRLRRGYFGYTLTAFDKKGKSISAGNYMFLLFDHLCAALSIHIRVDGDYHKLRHIKLKEITLQTKTADGNFTTKTDVAVTLKANLDSSDPIESITYTPTPGETEPSSGTMFVNTDGHLLTPEYQTFISHFMPQGVTTLVLTCVYDIYDTDTSKSTDGNLVRKDCKATNTIPMKKVFDRFDSAERGRLYTIDLTIEPTYLYVMSERDLNNPEMVVN